MPWSTCTSEAMAARPFVNSSILHALACWLYAQPIAHACSWALTDMNPFGRCYRYCFSLTDVADDYAAVAAGKLPKPKLGAFQVLLQLRCPCSVSAHCQ